MGLGSRPIDPAVDFPVNTPKPVSADTLTGSPHGAGAPLISLDGRGVALSPWALPWLAALNTSEGGVTEITR
jgi:hypothetical protein